MKKMRHLLASILIVLLISAALPNALGYTSLDPLGEVRLQLEYDFGGVEFRLYKIAGLTEKAGYELSESFSQYAVDLESIETNTQWLSLAQTLSAYISLDEIVPTASGETDADGILTFEVLEVGLYLVLGERYLSGSQIYTPIPYIVSLPGLTESDEWQYDVVSQVKYDERPNEDYQDITVIKLWKDEGNETNRPNSVEIQLLCDGVLADEVTLNEGVNWRHTWEDLDLTQGWQVAEEEVPSGYTVSITQAGTVFYVTNTYKGTSPQKPDDPSLPQTGQLWWPVPALAVGGILLFSIGWICLKEKKKEQ